MATQEMVLAGRGPVAAQQPVALAPATLDMSAIQRVSTIMASSGFFADTRDAAQAAVKVMAGQELGIPPVAAMMGINIIKGKVALGAHLIASRIRAHGYDFRLERHDNEGCTVAIYGKPFEGKREKLGVSSFGAEDAKAAGISSDMYRKYPRNMYYSRAVSNAAKWFCPEIFGGAPVYTPEELGLPIDSEGNALMQEAAKIDTGGAPVGTQEAANNVAARRFEELRQQQQAAPVETDPDVLQAWKASTLNASKPNRDSVLAEVSRLYKAMCELLGPKEAQQWFSERGFDGHELEVSGSKAAKQLIREAVLMLKCPPDPFADVPMQTEEA